MRIDEFPRPKGDNRRGIHWSASVYHPTGAALDYWIAELQAMKIKWVKVLDDSGGSSLELVQRLLAADIMPVVRLYRNEPNPGAIGGREEDAIHRLVAAGARYFETNNEPDLGVEWKDGVRPEGWLDIVVDNFIIDADKVLALGGLPALPSFAVGAQANAIERVVQRGRRDLFEKGAWIAVHNYALNHPIDYPYDPVNQEGQPVSQAEYDALGPWAWENAMHNQINEWHARDKNPGDTIADDHACFLGFQFADQMARKALGFPVPIISTEGGPVIGWKQDRRYPRVTPDLHCERVVGIAEYMQGTRQIHGEQCPDNYFAMCHWLLANFRLGSASPAWESQAWYTDWWNEKFGLHGAVPAVAALKALPGIAVKVGAGVNAGADGQTQVESKTNITAQATGKASITGQVLVADTGELLAGQTVQLLAGGKQMATTQTGADSKFVFTDIAPGTYDLTIEPYGVVRHGVAAIEGGSQPVIIRLAGGRSSVLSGTVLSAAGAAVAGIEVLLERDGQPLARAVSGTDGAFRFEGLTLGLYRLSMTGIAIDGIALDGRQAKSLKLTTGVAPGYKYIVDKKRLLPPEETDSRRLFYGTVTDALGAPLNGIKVQMSWVGAAAGTALPVKVTGSDPYKPVGYYEFLHTPGTFTLQIAQGDWPSDLADGLETAHTPGRDGQAITYEVNFRQQPAGAPAQVDGVIQGGQAGRKVTLAPAPGSASALATRQTVLAANGAFAFANTAPGAYELALEGVGVIARNIVIAPGALFKALLALRSRLSGKVTGSSEGLVAVLHAPAAWGWTRQTPLTQDGSFTFDNLPAGRYRLEVGSQVLTDLALTGENKLALADIDLSAGRRSIIRGRAADAAGQPRADRVVTLKREGVTVAETSTAADGTYRFANLSPGKYSVEVAGLGVVAKDITLDGEREAVVDVLWPSEGSFGVLQGRVLNVNGSPRPYAVVRLLKEGAELRRAESDVKGAFKFTGLAAGTYALAVGDSEPLVTDAVVGDNTTVVRDVTVPGGPPKVLAHYLLFAAPPTAGQAGAANARLLLALASYYLTGDMVAGFSVEEAKSATQVTIIGDRVAASTESTLTATGCQVTRLSGDGYAIVKALAQLCAEG